MFQPHQTVMPNAWKILRELVCKYNYLFVFNHILITFLTYFSH
jgi:hypothetical protein